MSQVFQDHPHYIHSFSPGALPTESMATPDPISDIVFWLASAASPLVTGAQIPAVKGYLKICAGGLLAALAGQVDGVLTHEGAGRRITFAT